MSQHNPDAPPLQKHGIDLSDQITGKLLSALHCLVMEVSHSGTIVSVLPTQYRFTRHTPDMLMGQPVASLLTPANTELTLAALNRCIVNQKAESIELYFDSLNAWFECALSPISPDTALIVANPITHFKENEIRYREILSCSQGVSEIDPLTGLPNKNLLISRLNHAIERLQRKRVYHYFILFIDLDRFRIVNESLGHDVGDQVLWSVAKRLLALLRKVDTIVRYARDEFIILLDEMEQDRDAFRVVERIKKDFARPFRIQGREIFLTASIGILGITGDYQSATHIIRDAETAMFRAKAMGDGEVRYQVFRPEMHERAVEFLHIETDLRKAIKHDEFVLYYQPIVELNSGQVTGLEALVRWIHPRRGMISPASFIPVAEETGLIVPIGAWVLRQACHQLKGLLSEHQISEHFSLSINISAKQFLQTDLTSAIHHVIRESGIPPRTLKLEITESVMMHDQDVVRVMCEQIRDLGVKLAIDDFGTGYSSLSYLHRFPFDTLKIDRSFVNKIDAVQGKHEKILQAIMSMATHLDMNVVAEGIENAHQLQRLREMDCHFGQGFYFSKPLDWQNLKQQLLSKGNLKTCP